MAIKTRQEPTMTIRTIPLKPAMKQEPQAYTISTQAVLKQLLGKSPMLKYFGDYKLTSVMYQGEAHFFVYHANPVAALLLPAFFSRQLGLNVDYDIIERTINNTQSHGIMLHEAYVIENTLALEFIAEHLPEHIEVMRLMHRIPGLFRLQLAQNMLMVAGEKRYLDVLQLNGDCRLQTLINQSSTEGEAGLLTISLPTLQQFRSTLDDAVHHLMHTFHEEEKAKANKTHARGFESTKAKAA